jgi:hypothetical protein
MFINNAGAVRLEDQTVTWQPFSAEGARKSHLLESLQSRRGYYEVPMPAARCALLQTLRALPHGLLMEETPAGGTAHPPLPSIVLSQPGPL